MVFRERHIVETYSGRATRFSDISETFECVEGMDNRLQQRARDQLRTLSRRGNAQVVDFGCGNGKLLAYAMKWSKTGLFLGIDASRVMLQEAANRLRPVVKDPGVTWKLVVATARTTPLPSGWADLCTAKFLLHHLPKPSAAMVEMARVTRPGGSVVVAVPGPGYQTSCRIPGKPWQSTGFPTKEDKGNLDPLGRFSEGELKELARMAGLRPVACYADNCVYRFATFGHYLAFMNLTGAEVKLRSYVEPHLSLANYFHGIALQTGVIEVSCEFATLEARKPNDD